MYTVRSSFPLDHLKATLEEFLALMEPVQRVVVDVQAHSYPIAATAVIRLALLRTMTINDKVPLKVIDYSGDPPHVGQGINSSNTPAAPKDRVPKERYVPHEELAAVTRATRENLLRALVWREVLV